MNVGSYIAKRLQNGYVKSKLLQNGYKNCPSDFTEKKKMGIFLYRMTLISNVHRKFPSDLLEKNAFNLARNVL